MQRSFLVIGSFLSGLACISIAVLEKITIQGVTIELPFIFHGVVVGKMVFLCAGAVCLGVQTHCYKIQKAVIKTIVKGIEG